jgi:hypothetical protein
MQWCAPDVQISTDSSKTKFYKLRPCVWAQRERERERKREMHVRKYLHVCVCVLRQWSVVLTVDEIGGRERGEKERNGERMADCLHLERVNRDGEGGRLPAGKEFRNCVQLFRERFTFKHRHRSHLNVIHGKTTWLCLRKILRCQYVMVMLFIMLQINGAFSQMTNCSWQKLLNILNGA